jgi:hypothetical protein
MEDNVNQGQAPIPTENSVVTPPKDDLAGYREELMVLCGGLFLFTIVVIVVAFVFPMDQGIYALFAGILGNFSGALFTKIRK